MQLMVGEEHGQPEHVGAIDWAQSLTNTNFVGPVTSNSAIPGSGDRPTMESDYVAVPIWTTVDHLLVRLDYYANLNTAGTKGYKWVNKEILNALTTYVAGKPRTTDMYNMLMQRAGAMMRAAKMDLDAAPVSTMAYLAMTANLKQDVVTANAVSEVIHSYENNALKIDQPSSSWPYMVGALSIAVLIAKWKQPFGSMGGLNTTNSYALCSSWSWAALLLLLWPSHSQQKRITQQMPIVQKLCVGHTTMPKLAQGAKIVVPGEYSPCPCTKALPAAQAVGWYVPRYPPIFPSNCAHNEVASLAYRQLVPGGCIIPVGLFYNMLMQANSLVFPEPLFKGTPTMVGVAKGMKMPALWSQGLFPVFAPVEITNFNEWVQRFPLHRRELFTKVKKEGFQFTREHSLIEAFVKNEASCKFDARNDEWDFYKPRNISGRKPEYQVRTGPWTLAASKWLASTWDGQQTGVKAIYTSGMTAEDLGRETSKAEKRAGAHSMILETDMTTYDGTQKEMLAGAIMAWLWSLQPPHETWEAICTSVACTGSTGHGVKFYGDWTMKSGEGWTSCGNTYLNIIVQVMAITTWEFYKFVDMSNSTLFGLGDDNMTFISLIVPVTDDIRRSYVKWVERFLSDLGLIPKLKLKRMADVEYCSGLFYQIDDGTLIWGPKPGRVLYKTGWVKAQGNTVKNIDGAMAELRGTINGLLTTVSHVPILADLFYNLMQQLTDRNVKATKMERLEHMILARTAHAVSVGSEQQLMDRYGLDSSQLTKLRIEARHHKLGEPLTNELFEHLVEVDMDLGPTKPSNLNHYATPFMCAFGLSFLRKGATSALRWASLASHHACVAIAREMCDGINGPSVPQGLVALQEFVGPMLVEATPIEAMFMAMYIIGLCPIVEEYFKRTRYGNWFYLYLCVTETLENLPNVGYGNALGLFVFKLLIHRYFMSHDYKTGVIHHMVWNAEMLLFGRFFVLIPAVIMVAVRPVQYALEVAWRVAITEAGPTMAWNHFKEAVFPLVEYGKSVLGELMSRHWYQ